MGLKVAGGTPKRLRGTFTCGGNRLIQKTALANADKESERILKTQRAFLVYENRLF